MQSAVSDIRGPVHHGSISKKALSIGIQYQNAALYTKGDQPPQLSHSHNDPDVLKSMLTRTSSFTKYCSCK